MITRQGVKTILDHQQIRIIYEDNHLLLIHKPTGVLSQADSSERPDILTLMKAYLKERYQKTGDVYLGLVHRLDYPVEGIMVLAKTSKAASRLSKEIREHRFEKRYLAVVKGRPDPAEGSFTDLLTKDYRRNRVHSLRDDDFEYGKAKAAKLNFRVLSSQDGQSLVEIDLISGRSHQIRVQFSSRGYPLVGDGRYDSREEKADGESEIALIAYSLSFKHPTKDEQLHFHTDLPKSSAWLAFQGVLYTLEEATEQTERSN